NGNRPALRILGVATPGQGRAQNAGWRAATATIIAYTDDDCYVTPNYVDSVLAAFKRDVGFVGGRVLLFDKDDLAITIATRATEFKLLPYTFVAAGDFLGANMAFRREILERIGGFDEDFGPGTKFVCNDVDAQA